MLVYDYDLMLLPALMRKRFPDITCGFFLHCPFPSTGETCLSFLCSECIIRVSYLSFEWHAVCLFIHAANLHEELQCTGAVSNGFVDSSLACCRVLSYASSPSNPTRRHPWGRPCVLQSFRLRQTLPQLVHKARVCGMRYGPGRECTAPVLPL